MATVRRWTGREAKLLRVALRLSLRDFAAHLGVGVRTINKWEARGNDITPQPHMQAILDTALQRASEDERARVSAALADPEDSQAVPAQREVRPGALLPVIVNGRPVLVPLDAETIVTNEITHFLTDLAATANQSAPPGVERDLGNPLDRRSLLKHGLTSTAFAAIGLDNAHRIALALADARHYLDGSVVDYFRRQLVACKADDGVLGSGETLPVVLGLLGAVEEHAREVRPNVRRELLSVGADSAEFAGWLYRDLHDTPRALFWHDRAMEWAQEAGDLAMPGYVLIRKAQLSYDEREPARMLTLSQAAQASHWQLPNRVRAEAIQQEARAEAMLGAAVDSVERKLDKARHLLENATDGVPLESGGLSAHYTGRLLTLQTAVCYAEAGKPARAVALYEKELNESAFSPRDYGFFLSWMAAALALAGEPDQAATTGLTSAQCANSVSSERTLRELTRVVDTLRPWRYRPLVRELRAAVHT